MDIVIDTREKKQELERIEPQLKELGVHIIHSKLYTGDYQSLDNARLVVDRKRDLLELAGNVTQQHERFKRELMRAMESGIKIVILCEHGEGITSMEDVKTWENPRRNIYCWVTKNGKKMRIQKYPTATNGDKLYKSLCTIHERYNVDFVFCDKENTGKEIVRILNEYGRN